MFSEVPKARLRLCPQRVCEFPNARAVPLWHVGRFGVLGDLACWAFWRFGRFGMLGVLAPV